MSLILVIGEAIADFLPDPADPTRYACALGGSGFNTALALARLGQRPAFAWSLPRDALGERFRRMMALEGADLALVSESARPMPLAVVQPAGASHGGMFALHLAGTAHEDAVLPNALPPGVVHVHAASFAATVGPAADAALALLRAAKASATSSYDPNIRAACLPPHPQALALVEERVAASTIAKASEEDLGWLYPGLAPHEALERWRMLGVSVAVATRGGKGALALGEEGFVEAAAPVVAVADTVGAGDVFTAAFLAAAGESGRLGAPPLRCGGGDLARWLAFAAEAAALSCARPGCDPPRRAEIGA